MLTTLKNAFKIKDIRTKIVYTLFMLIVVRLGSNIPTPGVAAVLFALLFMGVTAFIVYNGVQIFSAQ